MEIYCAKHYHLSMSHTKSIKRLNATLPAPLAKFVGEITGDDGLYKTPSEFIRDLIRRYVDTHGLTPRGP